MTRTSPSLAERLYRSLLLAYPAEFRRTVGCEAAHAFGRLHRDEWRAAGLKGLMVLWRRSVLHVIGYGLKERWERRRPSLGRHQDPHHNRQRPPQMLGLVPNFRYVVRSLARTPAFSLMAILIVALGVGATTTIYSVVDNVLLRPLPYPDPQELVMFTKGEGGSLSIPDFRDIYDQTDAFASLAAWTDADLDLTNEGIPERLTVGRVTAEFFSVLGASPAVGRLFTAGDFAPGANKVVVVDHGLWQRRWGGDPALVGSAVILDGETVTVLGVLKRDFQSPEGLTGNELDVWVPFDLTAPEWQHRNLWLLSPIGRLAPGATLASAQAEMDALAETLAVDHPVNNRDRDGRAFYFPLVPLHEAMVGSVAQPLYVLLGAVGLLLLIACANVANLFLARGTDREREIALRSALGAGRGRIVQQLLTESVALALLGGALGAGIAVVSIRMFGVFDAVGIPRMSDVVVDWRVLLFTVALSTLTGVLFGLIPALQSAQTDICAALQEGAQNATAGRHRAKLRNSFVVAEIALALMLLIGAGLLFNSFLRLRSVDPGVDPDDVTVMSLRLGAFDFGSIASGRYSTEGERIQFTNDLLETIRAFPNVQAAGATMRMPFGSGRCCWATDVAPSGSEDSVMAWMHPVTSAFMEALGATLVAGRFHVQGDMAAPAPSGGGADDDQQRTVAAVINRSLAERHWPDGDVLGRELHTRSYILSIVGVVDDIRHFGLDSPEQFDAYLPYAPDGAFFPMLDVAVRSSGDSDNLAAALRQAVWRVDPELPVSPPHTMNDRISGTITTPRFYSMLLAAFAAVAFLLAASGIASSMLYSVGQRQRELGIRLALGAQRRSLMRMVVGKGVLLTALGLSVGIGGAFALSRVLDSFVFGISTTDPMTFVAVSLLLATVAMLACYLPARKAAGADPLEVLRAE